MREDLRAYQRGLHGFLDGDDSTEAIAAGCNVAELLVMLREYLKGGG